MLKSRGFSLKLKTFYGIQSLVPCCKTSPNLGPPESKAESGEVAISSNHNCGPDVNNPQFRNQRRFSDLAMSYCRYYWDHQSFLEESCYFLTYSLIYTVSHRFATAADFTALCSSEALLAAASKIEPALRKSDPHHRASWKFPRNLSHRDNLGSLKGTSTQLMCILRGA